MNKKMLTLALVLGLGLILSAGLLLTGGEKVANASAMTELNVANLSCGSCVENIKQALAGVDGIGTVDVSVTSGRGQVTYDPTRIQAEEIAQVVTKAGYPAKVRLDLDAEQYRKLQTENEQLSAAYVARVGKRLVARSDFEELVKLRSGAALTGDLSPYATQQLQGQVWNELKEREILLAAAEKNQVVVQNGEVELEIKRIKQSTKDFDQAVKARFGSYERFFSQVRDNMIINRNIERNVIAGLTNDREKQLRFSQWYEQTQQQTDVVIFDPLLKQAEAAGTSSCGGSCGS